MFILVDDEDRENEGDLCIIGEYTDASAINFMAKHGRGLICLALTRERTESLGLAMMDRRNESAIETAFTVSIEAREGVTTGISAHDRARTIQVAINPQYNSGHITTPGHIFRLWPVMAAPLSVQVILKLLLILPVLPSTPAGVICEIMNDDGSMARLPDLNSLCQRTQPEDRHDC